MTAAVVDVVGLGAAAAAAAERVEAERRAFLSELRSLKWVPVAPPSPLESHLPLRDFKDEKQVSAGDAAVSNSSTFTVWVASPADVRPSRDLWLCSHAFFGTAVSVGSSELAAALGWNAVLSPSIAARQLRLIAERFATASGESGPKNTPTAAADLDGGGKIVNEQSSGSRQRAMTAVVPRLYAILDAAVNDCGAQIRTELAGHRWLWMGTRFVTSDQVPRFDFYFFYFKFLEKDP